MMDKSSQTMRIDLIPNVPTQPVKGKKKRVVIAPPTRTHDPVPTAIVQEVDPHPGTVDHFEELLQSVYDAALITDLNGQIVDANLRAVEFLQYDRDGFRGLTVADIISGATSELLETLSLNLENERFTLIQAYCIRHDGSFFPAEIAVNKLRLGDVRRLCFFIRDTTVRRQEQEMLRTEHNAIQNAGNGIAVADLEWKLEYVNPAVRRMWGYERVEELLGLDVRDLLGNTDLLDEMIRTVVDEHRTWSGEVRIGRKDGSETDIQVSVTGNRNSDGELVGTVFSFVDISDRKRAEDAVRESDRHRVMLESLGAACHHLGQPATVLMANLGIMQRHLGVSGDDLVQELIKGSMEASERLGEILHRLNAVNEYKTTQYLETPDGSDSPENRILQI